jgi:chaperonin GroES
MFGEDALRKLNAMSESDRLKLEAEATALTEQVVVEEAPVKFRAIQDRIIVRRVEEDEVSSGGIVLPDEGKEKPARGLIVAVGPGKYIDGSLQRPSVSVGEIVLFGKFSGAEIRLGTDALLALREEDLFIVLEQ